MKKANFNLSQFLSQSRRDSFARVNRFEVFIHSPAALSQNNRDAVSVSLYCEMASLPSKYFY